MSNNVKIKVLLVGTGPMAVAYSQVLSAQSISFEVVGRGAISAETFFTATAKKPVTGGLCNFLESTTDLFTHAIIATGTEALTTSLNAITDHGISHILIEKPAAISIEELENNSINFLPFSDTIFVAYNRHFYSSVYEAQRLIEEDGGLQSMNFEFTEWTHKIDSSKKAEGVMNNWFYANSTHVVDLAFFLAGKPEKWCAFSKSGKLSWHEKTNYSGAGITENGVVFSYLSNWESAGRWAIELLTERRRIYLKPLEGVSIQQKGSVVVKEHDFDTTVDIEFKPGLYKQVQAFLENDASRFVTIKQHLENSISIYKKILS
jgi:predicted dehydrogenase